MPRSQLHVFTGATGLVGSALVLEVLRADPHARVLAVVRGEEPATRLHQTLRNAARLQGLGDALDGEIRERCAALPGDLHAPGCGVKDPPAGVDQVWHCAAALQFKERYADSVMQTNLEGTRHMLELAEALGRPMLNVMSTAYVAGTHTGRIPEAPVDVSEALEVHTNNPYERSKVLAEALVRDSGLPARTLRPSIVMGHSQTYGALNFNGLYSFTRGVFKFRRLLERTQAHLVDSLEVRLPTDPDGRLDLVPMDFVARDALALYEADADPGIYHLTMPPGHSTRRVMEIVFEAVGLRRPLFVEDRDELTWLDRKLDSGISAYTAYLFGAKLFERRNTDRWVRRPAGADYRFTDDTVRRFCEWYIERELAPRERRETT